MCVCVVVLDALWHTLAHTHRNCFSSSLMRCLVPSSFFCTRVELIIGKLVGCCCCCTLGSLLSFFLSSSKLFYCCAALSNFRLKTCCACFFLSSVFSASQSQCVYQDCTSSQVHHHHQHSTAQNRQAGTKFSRNSSVTVKACLCVGARQIGCPF